MRKMMVMTGVATSMVAMLLGCNKEAKPNAGAEAAPSPAPAASVHAAAPTPLPRPVAEPPATRPAPIALPPVHVAMPSSPRQTVERFFSSVQDGKVEDALKLVSTKLLLAEGGSEKLRGEIESLHKMGLRVQVTAEQVSGDIGKVSVLTAIANGKWGDPHDYKVIKENGLWKFSGKY